MDRITRKQTYAFFSIATQCMPWMLYFYPLYLKEIYLKWLISEFWIGSLHGIEQKKNGEIMNHQNWFLFKNRRKKMQPFINKFFLTGSEYHFTVEWQMPT